MNLYYLTYTISLYQQTIVEEQIFQAVDNAAAQTEADSRTGAESRTPTDVKLFLIGTEI